MPSLPPYTPPTAPVFTGKAPKPTKYGDFTAPSALDFEHSPDYAYNVGEQQKAIQRGAAAHGTLLTGGLQMALQRNASGLASQDYQNAFGRALSVYDTNRGTNDMNFGHDMASYGGDLNAFNANAGIGLGYARLGQDDKFGTYDREYRSSLDKAMAAGGGGGRYGTMSPFDRQQAEYEQRMEQERAQNDAAAAAGVRSKAAQEAAEWRQRRARTAGTIRYASGGY